jgi:hypothetical protein
MVELASNVTDTGIGARASDRVRGDADVPSPTFVFRRSDAAGAKNP